MAEPEPIRSSLDRWIAAAAAFDSETVESLQSQPESASEDREGFTLAEQLTKAKVDKANQENKLRDRFFVWAFVLASVVIGANFVLMGYYAISVGGNVPREVMMFWISATVVKILGIIYIIAQYLFPKPRSKK